MASLGHNELIKSIIIIIEQIFQALCYYQWDWESCLWLLSCISYCVIWYYRKPFSQWQSSFQMKAALPLAIRFASVPGWIILNRVIVLSFFNALRPIQNGCQLADEIFKCISFNENFPVLNKISLKYIPMSLIDNTAALVQIMAWHQRGGKPSFEAVLVCYTDTYIHHPASMS